MGTSNSRHRRPSKRDTRKTDSRIRKHLSSGITPEDAAKLLLVQQQRKNGELVGPYLAAVLVSETKLQEKVSPNQSDTSSDNGYFNNSSRSHDGRGSADGAEVGPSVETLGVETVDGETDMETITIGRGVKLKFADELRRRNATEIRKLTMTKRAYRIAILGSCNSGKSTLIKQFHTIFLDGLGQDELNEYRDIIVSNCLQSIRAVLEVMPVFKIGFENGVNIESSKMFLEVEDAKAYSLFCETNPAKAATLLSSIHSLNQDQGFWHAMQRGNEYKLLESAEYLIENAHRFLDPMYKPSDHDVLMCRNSTVVSSEYVFHLDEAETLTMIDVGGYRYQRQKWQETLANNINMVVFVASLAAYDMLAEEDETKNQLIESLILFETFINDSLIKNMPVMLVLSKRDVLVKKCAHSPLQQLFPDFTGDKDPQSCIDYIRAQFTRLDHSEHPEFVTYAVNSTDREIARMAMPPKPKLNAATPELSNS